YTQSAAPIREVVGLVLRSGAHRMPEVLAAELGAPFTNAVRMAQARVDAGEPEARIDTQVPRPGGHSAAAFLDKFGPAGGRYDWLPRLEQIAVPKLLLFGGADEMRVVQAAREAVQGWPRPLAGCEVHVVVGADHGFGDHAQPAADLVAQWWARHDS